LIPDLHNQQHDSKASAYPQKMTTSGIVHDAFRRPNFSAYTAIKGGKKCRWN
jgi:hypothetical protein